MIPAQDVMYTEAVAAIYAMLIPGVELGFLRNNMSAVAWKRNLAVQHLLATPRYQWLLFVDSDMTPPPDTIRRLLAHQKDIVGALYYLRRPDDDGRFPPAALGLVGPDGRTLAVPIDGGVHEVSVVATGCLLIRRHVLEAVPGPWFVANQQDIAEDEYFCRLARAAGFQIYLDTGCVAGHMRPMTILSSAGPGGEPRSLAVCPV
jgi:GT2 family glycosyltransferase